MTQARHFASPEESVLLAYRRMVDNDVRHLPVLSGQDLVGVLFRSDLKLVESLAAEVVEPVRVQSLMVTDLYTVSPEEAIDVAAREMSRRKDGAALVVSRGKVVGVFTSVDALHALSDALTDSLPESMRFAAYTQADF
jgi:acetoin utilization protein AcuB